tara:strand:- start:1229 stop:1501 length:273 start_codon:yes stop_codon:yes gene_type:complete
MKEHSIINLRAILHTLTKYQLEKRIEYNNELMKALDVIESKDITLTEEQAMYFPKCTIENQFYNCQLEIIRLHRRFKEDLAEQINKESGV